MITTFIIIIIALIFSLVCVIRIAKYGGSVIRPDFRKALERINRGNMFSFLIENRFWYRSNVVGYYLIWFMWLFIFITLLCVVII